MLIGRVEVKAEKGSNGCSGKECVQAKVCLGGGDGGRGCCWLQIS